jgi:hypothetical protein
MEECFNILKYYMDKILFKLFFKKPFGPFGGDQSLPDDGATAARAQKRVRHRCEECVHFVMFDEEKLIRIQEVDFCVIMKGLDLPFLFRRSFFIDKFIWATQSSYNFPPR